ncbi:MAG: HAD family hydrolase [Acidobacteria bacterium]|nr:HAD family hydrolase [Acidobacteriota bacterium]
MKPPKRGSLKPRRAPAGARNETPRRAVFLDRDGTICEEMGYMNHLRRFSVLSGSREAIRALNNKGVPVIVVTNQSGVSRGFFPETLVHQVHERMKVSLLRRGAYVDGIYYCPHKKGDGCKCRKPLTGMIEQAAREHNLRLKGSWVVSDRYADLQMGHAVGAHSALVMTGYGRGEYTWNRKKWRRQPDVVAEDLGEVVRAILKRWAR